jgi:hypothetical protein
MYIVLKNSGVEDLLRRWRRAGRGLDQLKRMIQRHLWVRVQSGLSQGMWMQLRLPTEGAYWRGTHETDVQNAISVAVPTNDNLRVARDPPGIGIRQPLFAFPRHSFGEVIQIDMAS